MKEEPKQDLEKEMFELEQELDIPSHLRWHNSKPKQETLEEAAERYDSQYYNKIWKELRPAFIAGAKWQQEQDKNKYSEDDLKDAYMEGGDCDTQYKTFQEWFEQFKNK
jgi:predicted nuclease with TOPRIM domain